MRHRFFRPLVAIGAIAALGIIASACTQSNGAVEKGTAAVALQTLGRAVEPSAVTCADPSTTANIDNVSWGAQQCHVGTEAPFWVISRYANGNTTAQAIAYVPMTEAGRVHFGSGWFAVTVNWRQSNNTWSTVGTPTVTPVQSLPIPTPAPVPTAPGQPVPPITVSPIVAGAH